MPTTAVETRELNVQATDLNELIKQGLASEFTRTVKKAQKLQRDADLLAAELLEEASTKEARDARRKADAEIRELRERIAALRPVAAEPRTRRDRPADDRSEKIREWARGKGLTVASRGRISAEVVEQYEKAHAE